VKNAKVEEAQGKEEVEWQNGGRAEEVEEA